MRRLITITALLVALSFTVGVGMTGASSNGTGPSADQLIAAGWTCFVIPEPAPWLHCFAPGVDLTRLPPNVDLLVFDAATGDFLGSERLIRADLYHGQPCPQAFSGQYHPTPTPYFACHHFPAP